MRKVRNNQAIKRLSSKSFQASRTRNIIAVIAIVLTAVLFTAVFTIGIGIVESTQRSSMMQAGGDMHGSIKRLTQEQYEKLKTHPSIKESVCDMPVSQEVQNPEFLKRHLEMHYVEKSGYSHWFIDIIDGKAPEKADEILLDETSMKLLGAEPKAGEQVTLEFLVHYMDTETVKRTFTVSGVIRASEAMNVGFCYVSEAYLEKYAQELQPKNEDDFVGARNMGIVFANSLNIQEKLNKIITDSGYSVDEDSADYIASNANWAYMSDGAAADPMTVAGIAGALILILITGYLIIYNIFQISVIRDIRYYGLLKTIGTTGRQIKRILRRQAIRLCLMGIPAGLVLGFLAGKLLLPIVMMSSSYERSAVAVSPRLWIFAGAAVFTIVTVLISEWKPGRIAAKVSPVEALRYTEHGTRQKKQKKSTDGGRIIRMAFSNLGRSRGRTAVVICSLSLTIVLLNSVYTITRSVDREGMLSKMILSEAVIGNAALWNYDYRPWDEVTAAEEGLSERFVSACEQQESFEDGGRIYATFYNVTMPLESWKVPDYFAEDENGMPGCWYGGRFQAFVHYDEDGSVYSTDIWTGYHGIEPFVLSKMTIIEGETDKDIVWEKLQSGNYLIYAADVDDDNIVIDELIKHHAGDKVTLKFDGKETKEYEIISVIKRHQYSLTNRVGNNFEYYVSADEFKKHMPASFLMNYLLDVKEGQEDAMEAFLKDYTTNTEPSMNYESRQTFSGMADQVLGTIGIVGTALAGVIGLIGILNFINTILTAMVTRKREFAMMEAIGMTKRQLVRMLMAEGLCYAVMTIVFSLAAGVLFSLTVIRTICDGIWLMNYKFTLVPMFIACPILFLLGACIPKAVYTLRRKESIVEELRE